MSSDLTSIRNAFNTGEISPKLDARGEIDKYKSACLAVQNMVPLVEGGVMRMPGTVYVAEVKTSAKATRVLRFQFSTTQAYVIEFGDQYVRFYKDEAQITSGGGAVEVATPYLEADLFKLKFTQSADVLYIWHPSYAPRKLTRTSHTAWTLTTITFRPPPTQEFGLEPNTTLTPGATTGTGVTFTAGAAGTFLASDAGRVIVSGASRASIVTYSSGTQVVCDILDAFASTDPIASGSWEIQGSPVVSVTPSGGTKKGVICTLTAAANAWRAGDVGKYVFINNGFLKITTYTSALAVNGEILSDLSSSSASTAWTLEEEKWNATRGYPAVGFFFEQRLATAGATLLPQTVDMSVSGDYENFSRDPDSDDAAVSYTLVSNQVERTNWLAGSDYLMIGTRSGLWRLGASKDTEALTQTNVNARKQGKIAGTKDLAPVEVTDSIIWVGLSGMTVHRMDYSFETDKFVAVNMTRLAEHITKGDSLAESGIVDMDFQQAPVPIVWAVRADGVLLGMTYETQENIYAWFRVVTDGYFESVAVISDTGEEDQIWVVVRRTIDGATVRYIEYFKPMDIFGQISDSFFVHSGATYDGGDAVEITGITQANPAVVSAVNSFTDGDEVKIADVTGMTQANTGVSKAWTVANRTANDFELSGIDSTGWDEYVSGGTVQAVKKTFTTGIDHLEGETVDVLADGATHPQETVTGGSITLDRYANKVHIGLPAPCYVEPTKPHIDLRTGTSRSKRQRIDSVQLSLYKSYGAKVGPDINNLKPMKFGIGSNPTLFTGEKVIDGFLGSWSREPTVVVYQDLPLPLHVRSIIYGLGIGDD